MQLKTIIRPEILSMDPEREYAHDREKAIKYDLSLNINPFGVSANVINKLRTIQPDKISHYYTENKTLIKRTASYIKAEQDNILLGDGCDGCLGMIASTFISNGDETIIPIPSFHRYEFHTRLMGGTPIFAPSHDFIVRASDILGKVSSKSKLIFLCDPNNPTGMGIKPEEKEEIIRKFHGIVVIDEALADTTSIDNSQLIKKYNNVIIVRSFSKAFGLAALRIGYIIAGKDIVVMVAKASSPFKVNGLAQELAIEALADSSYIKDSAAFIDKNSYFLRASLNKLGIACTDSITTNFLADISSVCKSSKEFVQKLVEKNVLVTDASVFMVPKNIFIRVAVSSEEDNAFFLKSVKELIKHAH